jgi:hypothetical protein
MFKGMLAIFVRSLLIPIPESVLRQLGICGINQIHRVPGIAPRVNQVRARENLSHVLARAGVVDDCVAVFSEAAADDNVAARLATFSSQPVVANRQADGDAARNLVLQFRHVAQARHISAHSAKRTGVRHVENPVGCSFRPEASAQVE